jgi:hypothetical protein
MTDGARRPSGAPIETADVDLAGRHVLGAIEIACGAEADFPAKVGAALDAVFGLVAANPKLAHQFFGHSELPGVLERQGRWRTIFADRLREAAKDQALSSPPLPKLTEPFAIAAVGSQVLRFVERGEVEDLTDLLPELLVFILIPYYAGPAEARAAIRESPGNGAWRV